MAEMLVDSTKLDACLDAEADAIRAKTGGSSDILFDYANNKGFADAIASIQTGGGAQKVLLASGTYTQASDRTVIVIPVTVPSGTTDAFIEVDEETIDTSSNYCTAIYLYKGYQQMAKTVLDNKDVQMTTGKYVQTGATMFGYSNGGIDSNRIYGYGKYSMKAGTYNWYIWGYAE